MSDVEAMIQSGLLSIYERRFPSRKEIRIYNIKGMRGGWETELYSFTIEYREATGRRTEDLVLRIYPGDDALQKSVKEFKVMRALHELGFPVPKVLLLELGDHPFGRPFVVMERVEGRSMRDVLLESAGERRRELIMLFCKILADLHFLDWRPFVELVSPDLSLYETRDAYAWIDHKLSEMKRAIDRFHRDEFGPLLDWLEARSMEVPCERPSLIHGDYHPDNIILRKDGMAFVIDWGAADIGDYRSDLAWTLLLVGTYWGPEAREAILRGYEQASGHRVTRIEYFEVMAILRRLLDVSVSLSEGAGRRGMRPGAEEKMRRDADHLRRVYALLIARTGIVIPEVERLLSALT